MSEITVDLWMALSVVPMLIALGIYMWLSWRFERTQRRDARRYEDMVDWARAPLQASLPGGLPHGRPGDIDRESPHLTSPTAAGRQSVQEGKPLSRVN